jgi:hypothetical protein
MINPFVLNVIFGGSMRPCESVPAAGGSAVAQAEPGNAGWQRDVRVCLGRLAGVAGGGLSWVAVLQRMEAMKARGVLLPTAEPLLEKFRAFAAGKQANGGRRCGLPS